MNTYRTSTSQRRLNLRRAHQTIQDCETGMRAANDIIRAMRTLPEQWEDVVYRHEIECVAAKMVQRRDELSRTITGAKRVIARLERED